MTDVKIIASTYSECKSIVEEYSKSLSGPMESWMEEALLTSDFYKFDLEGTAIGYFCIKEETLKYFYVTKQYFVLCGAAS